MKSEDYNYYISWKGSLSGETPNSIGVMYGSSSILGAKGEILMSAIQGGFTLKKKSLGFDCGFKHYVEIEGYLTLLPYEGLVKDLFESDPEIFQQVNEIGDLVRSLGKPNYKDYWARKRYHNVAAPYGSIVLRWFFGKQIEEKSNPIDKLSDEPYSPPKGIPRTVEGEIIH